MDNKRARKIQREMIFMCEGSFSIGDHDRFEILNDAYELELRCLPQEALLKNEEGFLLSWESKKELTREEIYYLSVNKA